MMKMNRAGKIMLSSLLGLTLLAGCGGSGSGTGEGTASGGDVIVNLTSEPSEMNSFMNNSSVSGNVLRHVVEGLTTLDVNDKAVPGVAETWDVSEDKMTYTFHLRKDAKWNNGDPVTAKDFVFAWNQLFATPNGASYGSTWATLVEGAEELMAATKDGVDTDAAKAAFENVGYKALDDNTFEVKFTGPYPYIDTLMSFYSFAPINEKLYNEYGKLEGYAKDFDKIAYNGPFTMTSWTHEDNIVLEKNENYWNKDAIKLNKITFKMISDTGAARNEFENGDIDMIGLNGEQAKDYRAQGKNVKNFDDGSVWYLEFNVKTPGLNNTKVRRALTMGIDAQSYIDNVVLNNSKVAQSNTAPTVRDGKFTETVGKVWPRSTDYTEAKALLEEGLAEEGLTLDTFDITLLGDTGDTGKKTYEFVQEQLKKNLGVNMKIEQVEFKTRIQRMNDHEFDIVWAGWSADYNDPMSYLELWLTGGGNNNGEYSNPAYDEAITAAYKEGDEAKRDELLLQAEKIIAEDAPIGVVYYRSRDFICSDRLVGISRSAYRDIDLRFAEVK